MRRLAIALLVLAAAVIPAAPQSKPKPLPAPDNCRSDESLDPQQVLADCAARIKSGRLKDADLVFAHNRRGLAYQRLRDPDSAIKEFELAIKTDPKYLVGYANMANALRMKGEPERALATVEAGLRVGQNPYLYYVRAMIAASRGSWAAVIDDLNRMIELKSDYAPAYVARGDAYNSLAQLDKGCPDYETAIKTDPRNSFAHSGRANCLLERRAIDPAMSAANTAIGLNPENANAYAARGRVWRAKRENDQALADFSMAIRIRPNSSGAYVDRGGIWRMQGEFDKAIEDFSAALRLDPNYTSAYTGRGLAYLAKSDIEAARKDLQTAVDLPPKYVSGVRAQEAARARLELLVPTRAPDAPREQQTPAPARPGPGLTPSQPSRRVALVIGNGQYTNVAALPNPSNDARAVGSALRELGFEVIEGIDVGRGAMDERLREFLQKSAAARIALMFYAGHGMQVEGQNYLLPVDARLAARTDLESDTLSLDKIVSALEDDVRANIIMLDACRDNPLAARFAEQARRARSLASGATSGGLAAYSSVGTGTLIAFATGPGQVAEDGDGNNSPFTTALLKHIKNAELEVRQMMSRVRAEVAVNTARKQIPWDNSSLLGDIYLGRKE